MKRTFILLISILLLSCNQNPKTNQDKSLETEYNTKTEIAKNLDWLIGNWKRLNDEAGKETFENWKKISSGEYSGIGFTMQKGDTMSQEKMDIIKTNGKWTLYVITPDEKEATSFEMNELKNNEIIWVNDSIEFPKKIRYWMEDDKMKAIISNDEMEIPFEFEKIK